MFSGWITPTIVFNGAVTGLVYGLLAMGVVLIYRSTRVINFAVGNLGIVGSALFGLLVLNYDFPFWAAFAFAILAGFGFAAAVELVIIRRLFHAPRVILLVATVGIAQLAQAVVAAYPDFEASTARYPVAIGSRWRDVFGINQVRGSQLTIIVLVPLLALGLGWMLNRTDLGRAITASADNPRLARLSGINPKFVSTFVWVVAGLLSTLSLIMLSGESGAVTGIANLGPLTLGKALAAALIARMVSFPGAVVAGVAIGIVDAVIRFNFVTDAAVAEIVLFGAIMVALGFAQRTSRDDDVGVFSFAPPALPVPAHVRDTFIAKHLGRIVTCVLLGAVAVIALAHTSIPGIELAQSRFLLYSTIACIAICALSVTVVTGWSGQLSLAQMTFAGIGALLAAALTRGVELDIGWGDARLIDVELGGIPMLAAVAIAPLLVAGLAAGIGIFALRVRGLLLALATFVFAIAAQTYLYRRPLLSDGNPVSVPFARGELFGLDLSDQRSYFLFCLAVLAMVTLLLARLRASGVVRSIIATRDNSSAAAAVTVAPVPVRLQAFALAGALAGLGGALLGGALQSIPLTGHTFQVGDSLQLVGMAVIGGLGSLAGPIIGALWVEGLPAFFPGNDAVPLFTSSIGIIIILMYFPGGIVQVLYRLRNALLERMKPAPAPVVTAAEVVAPPQPLAEPPADALAAAPAGAPAPLALSARGVSVSFGGNRAVQEVDLDLARDEVVGLIGTNGAGKTTLMNAIGGFVPADGSFALYGKDISGLQPHSRASAGLGRTFQTSSLFGELTVRETVLVALESQGRTPLVATVLGLPHARRIDRAKHARAAELIDFLGLGRYADRQVVTLSTGTRRIVELAGLLALDASVVCFDEPTAGVAQRETEALAPVLLNIRAETSTAMLLIEHDMPFVMSVSDRIYCLEAGRVIAVGQPEQIRHDPAVIASYLGTDERAIARSDTR